MSEMALMATAYRIKNWKRFQHYNVKDRKPEWIKLYKDILDDPEWHDLDPIIAKRLIMLWLIASEDDLGTLPCNKKIAFRLRITESLVESTLSKLTHWIDSVEIADCKQDDSALSLRREETLREERREEELLSASGEAPLSNGFSPDDMATIWNGAVEHYSKTMKVFIPKILGITPARRKKAVSRIVDCTLDKEKWCSVVNKVHESDFLSGRKTGKGHDNWKANFDFVVRSQDVIMKILEGGYS